MTDEPVFQLRGVRHLHGPRLVLSLPSLDVARGEILCVLGPTGAGKSTLLRLLAGVERPTIGVCTFSGTDATTHALPLEDRRQISMVFQHPLLLAGSVRRNVEYGLKLRKRPDRCRLAGTTMERLGILGLAGRPVRTLSHGQRQLVALARSLAIGPRVLILDEPTANLDPATVALVESLILGENRDRGMTVIWATHHLFQARRIAHRTGLILNGELAEVSETGHFFDSPRDARTRAFVRGEMVY